MARYRKIDTRIWNDEKFQELWAARWAERSRVPRSRPYPYKPMPEREALCLSTRLRFKKVKVAVFAEAIKRLGRRCTSCGARAHLVPDHVIPITWGGTNDTENIQPLCVSCNALKGHLLPQPPENCNGHA